jgi:3-hydroxyethyl bacteriochlorophyllide a dehydrogenase
MQTLAVVLEKPGALGLRALELTPMGPGDLLVEIAWSGISTGTERLLWSGAMPPFPGLGYPLVPGYESVGRVVAAGADVAHLVNSQVFVPGASCYREARGLFGGTARRLVVPASRVVPLPQGTGEEGVLFALAATALHALELGGGPLPDLIIGHGALGRLLARLAVGRGGAPRVWETNPARRGGAQGYDVIDPADDDGAPARRVIDVSGAAGILDTLVGRLGRGGEIVLAGFYDRVDFAFPAAFMKEISIRIAAEFVPADLVAVAAMVADGRLALDGLVTHRAAPDAAANAYATAFTDPDCIKMVLDWREAA